VVNNSNTTTANTNTTTTTNIAFEDQAPVRAALQGHLLILDGLERAERNVLPTLNNLLENRELPLEDGRLLVSHERYQQLMQQQQQPSLSSFLVPVHPDFRCLALYSVGSAATASGGGTSRLDPPVRSRFQIRRIDPPSSEQLYQDLLLLNNNNNTNIGNNDTQTIIIQPELAQQLTVFAASMDEAVRASDQHSVAHFPVTTALPAIARARTLFPQQPLPDLLRRAYPTTASSSSLDTNNNDTLERVCRELKMITTPTKGNDNHHPTKTYYEVDRIDAIPDDPYHLQVQFRPTSSSSLSSLWDSLSSDQTVSVIVPSGGHGVDAAFTNSTTTKIPTNTNTAHSIVPTLGTQHVLTALLQEHAVGRDVLLLSPKGQGKSRLAQHFAHRLNYQVHLFPLYKEMTAQDLLLRRTTSSSSSSSSASDTQRQWTESPLLTAARTGQLCILDGVDKIAPDALATLQSLLTDRIVELPDGTQYSLANRSSNNGNSSTTMVTIHPSFRVLALASSSNMKQNAVVSSMFSMLTLPEPTRDCLRDILQPHNTYRTADLEKILDFHELLLEASDECGVQPLSIRTLLRLVQHGRVDAVTATTNNKHDGSLHDNICSCLLAELLPPTQRATLESLLRSCGIVAAAAHSSNKKRWRDTKKERNQQERREALAVEIDHDTNTLKMGDFSMTRSVAKKPELVPSPYFFDIPSHLHLIQKLLGEWSIAGERAFLLLGNQGTGAYCLYYCLLVIVSCDMCAREKDRERSAVVECPRVLTTFCSRTIFLQCITGKNKIVDRICELGNFEREYIQLHRDSTISQLTLSPSLEDGKIVWKDSPLVRAVTEGRALVIDEADKAPLEVVAVLKSLIEDGQLLLADGRRILRHGADKDKGTTDSVDSRFKKITWPRMLLTHNLCESFSGEIAIHKNFTVWVLANRPGRLFHGNDFFRETGDWYVRAGGRLFLFFWSLKLPFCDAFCDANLSPCYLLFHAFPALTVLMPT